jgi:hypothetical protein
MKYLIGILIVFFVSESLARVGETLPECMDRYGEVLNSFPQHGRQMFVFMKSGFMISVQFYDGVVDGIMYMKAGEKLNDHFVKPTNNELQIFLNVNGGDLGWIKRNTASVDREWITEDGRLVAVYLEKKSFLIINTTDSIKRLEAQMRMETKSKLDGF